jgi:peptide/nickel transport system permease protein
MKAGRVSRAERMTRGARTDRSDGLVGLVIVAAIIASALLAPVIAPHGANELLGEVWGPVSAKAWLGTDNLGRDMLSRVLYGGQVTLLLAFAGTMLAFVIGCALGLLAAVAGGWTDAILSRLVDAFMSVPSLICALVILSVLGSSVPVLVGTLAALAATRVYRLSRALGAEIVAMEFFEAALLRRESMTWLVFAEILPNIRAPLATEFGLRLCYNFLLVASLSFLGLGVQPPLADWGSMVRDNASAINFGGFAPLVPAAAIGLFVIGVNLIVDWGLARQARRRG